MKILFELGVSDDQYSVPSSEECSVGKRYNRSGYIGNRSKRGLIKLLLNPGDAPVVCSRELCKGLPVPNILIPQSAAEADMISRRKKLTAASSALITLAGTDGSVLLYFTRATAGTLFLIRIT